MVHNHDHSAGISGYLNISDSTKVCTRVTSSSTEGGDAEFANEVLRNSLHRQACESCRLAAKARHAVAHRAKPARVAEAAAQRAAHNVAQGHGDEVVQQELQRGDGGTQDDAQGDEKHVGDRVLKATLYARVLGAIHSMCHSTVAT